MNNKPLVSFCIFAYNQELYIADAIKGALSQTYDNMEIIVSDDCSIDNTWNIIKNIIQDYGGEKRIVLNRNEKNMRLVPHVNHVIHDIAHGEIIVLAGGDDISFPDRVDDTVAEFMKHPSAMAVCGQPINIDKYGQVIKSNSERRDYRVWKLDDEYIKTLNFMVGVAALSIRRTIFDIFGPLNSNTPTEDSTLRFRAILSGEVVESEKKYVYYRSHDTNLSRPQNIYKLKTNDIALQYKIDILKAQREGIIDQKMGFRLKIKVLLYRSDRNLAAKKQSLSRVYRVPYKLLQNINRILIKWV